jgi:hypothetical protein
VPSACCCWRYHTLGTEQGDWYLPAIGELGYAVNKINFVNSSIEYINEKFGTNYPILHQRPPMLSSTYKGSGNVWGIRNLSGVVEGNNWRTHYAVWAFLRV